MKASPKVVSMPLGTRTIEIAFAAISFASVHPPRLQCRLEGLDRDWIDLTNRNTVAFEQLPPRPYQLRIRSAQFDGSWSPEESSIAFAVLPRYSQTWSFRLALLVALSALLACLYQYRVSQLQRQQLLQQTFAQRLIQSQESERKRIAADLHDSLGQKLLVIKNSAQLALKDIERLPEVREQLERVSGFASDSLEEIRQIARNLRPYQLDQIGLTKAIRSLVKDIEQSSSLNVHLELENLDGVLAQDQEINFYRIVQEALNNIVRHAEATDVSLCIAIRGSELCMTITDNGKGFSKDRFRGGFGLSNLQERVQILAGTIEINSAPGTGTRLFARLPLQTS
jgi:signal transduction histidine kinase